MNGKEVPAPETAQRPTHSADDYLSELDEVEKKEAGKALVTLLDRHVDKLVSIARETEIKRPDLISSMINNAPIDEAVRRGLASLHDRVQQLIYRAASVIEDNHYEQPEASLQQMDLTLLERNEAETLLAADKKKNISCQSMQICMELFGSVNEIMDRRLEDAFSQQKKGKDVAREIKHLTFVNAVLCYEITDFLIKYIEAFEMAGVDEFRRIHNSVEVKMKDIHAFIATMKESLKLQPPDEQQRSLQNLSKYEDGAKAVTEEWQKVMEELDRARESTVSVRKELNGLRFRRDEAKLQLMFLDVVQVIAIMRGNLSSLQSAISSLKAYRIQALDGASIRRLLGVM